MFLKPTDQILKCNNDIIFFLPINDITYLPFYNIFTMSHFLLTSNISYLFQQYDVLLTFIDKYAHLFLNFYSKSNINYVLNAQMCVQNMDQFLKTVTMLFINVIDHNFLSKYLNLSIKKVSKFIYLIKCF